MIISIRNSMVSSAIKENMRGFEKRTKLHELEGQVRLVYL